MISGKGSVVVILAGLLLVSPLVGAFEVTLTFSGPPLIEGYSHEYFTSGFWIVSKANYTTHTYFTKIVNASTNRTVLAIDDRVGPVVPVNGGAYLLVSTIGNEYSLRLYRMDGGAYTLVWKLDTSKYGWVSYILPVESRDLILAGTVDVSPNDFGGHYVIGLDFKGTIKFATNLHVIGQSVSDIIPAGDRKYLVIVPGLGRGTPYLGLIDESGNVVRFVRINYPVASFVYLQGHKFVMVSWRKKSEGYIKDLKTYYGIWTLNLTPVATVELPYGFLGATPVFDNDSLYLFTVKELNSKYTLVESKYLLNGTFLWSRNVQELKFSKPPEHYGLLVSSVRQVLLPYSNVHVGVYPVGKVVNIVALDFKNAVPLANVSIPLTPGPNYYPVDYDAGHLYTRSKVYFLNTSSIPSAVLIDSNLPANATVDGKYSGLTPFYLKVEPGKHKISIIRRDYSPVERVLTVGPHEGIRFFANLTPLNATVILNSTPAAEVDIVPAGITVDTPSRVSLRDGTYTLIFGSRDYPSQYGRIRKTITLRPNETTVINVELPLIRSKLLVTSNVENATVYVDGKRMGKVPLKVFVVPGSHNITVTAEGYLPKSIEVNATGPVFNVSISLTPVVKPRTTSPSTSTEAISPTDQARGSGDSTKTQSGVGTHSICGPGFFVVLFTVVPLVTKRRKRS
ncbi:PEGA domain-containing protein [Thermococcus sp.]|uniref:PEGA domain-containing protein n=1 Tax=Thermococcus sp. TaxID=35749 RepID=UPI0026231D4A|nr:PEGA domain-containing protein [Thermococcus sp.]